MQATFFCFNASIEKTKMIRFGLLYIQLFFVCSILGQRNCVVNNLWVNGNFEDTTMSCYILSPANKLSNQNSPWYGFAMFRWQPTYTVQPTYLNEATKDHTLGTGNGHYLYIDPRNQSGYKYQFYQTFKVQKSTWYNFSMWYCSMNKPGMPGATIRLTVNNSAINGDVTIANNNDVWIQIKGSWFSGSDTTAIASLETLYAQIHGHDFAIDDIVFGTGLLRANAGPDVEFCADNPVNLSAIAWSQLGSRCRSFDYSWEPAANISGNNHSTNVALKNPAQVGNYILIVKDLNGNVCRDTMLVSQVQFPNPPLYNDTNLCPGQSATYTIPAAYTGIFKWNDGSTQNPRSFNKTGEYIIHYNNICGSVDDTILIHIDSLQKIQLLGDTVICDGKPYTATISGQHPNTEWDNGSSGISRTVNNSSIIWVRSWNRCESYTDTQRIIYDSLPKNLTPQDTIFCGNINYTINIPTKWKNIVWWDGNTQITRTFLNEGLYSLNFTGLCGKFYDSIRIYNKEIAPFNLGKDTEVCLNGKFILTAPSNYFVLWNTGEKLSSIGVSNPGLYVATLSNSFGCSRSDSIEIKALSTLSDIFMPTAFTPDDNGLNDMYPFLKFSQPVHFSIYNRWGEKLFESDGKRCWNGKINDKVCQEGAYAWKLSFIDCDGYRKVKTGNFTLIR